MTHAVALLMLMTAATCRAEIFTAMADMELMLAAESQIPSVVDSYIQREHERLAKLKELSDHYKSQNEKLIASGVNHVSNPVNAFLLIKSLTDEWAKLESVMLANSAQEILNNITSSRALASVKFPTTEDVGGAAAAIMRLQDVYQLKTSDLADGNIKGAAPAMSALTAHDCFELGRTAYNQADYYHTLSWMQEAVDRVGREQTPTIAESEVLEYLAYAHYQQGNTQEALKITRRLNDIDPQHPRAAGNIKWYLEDMEKNGITEGEPETITNARPLSGVIIERDSYEALCRGETSLTPAQLSKLYCYLKADRAFLRLAPIKVEVVHLDPLAVIYRQVMTEAEAAIIKQLAHPKLNRATVQNPRTGELEPADYRVSKSAWLKSHEDSVVDTINKRIADMTNLNMDTAEDLQVANYGIGGHYDVHFDFARKTETNAFKGLGTGNRIATVLFYMSTPEAGGATVFPQLGVGVFPTFGDALYWYNLHKDGDGDERTIHAACPVLAGTKWVCNKWIHERGQEFARPCGMVAGVEANENYIGEL